MAIAKTYSLVIEPESELGYFGRTLEMPFVMSDGRTPMKCVENVREATALVVGTMLEEGETPPRPAREGKRTQQVNIRLSAEEKLALEGIAAREGYRSISDYVRASILRRAG